LRSANRVKLRFNDEIFVRPLAPRVPFGYNTLIIKGKIGEIPVSVAVFPANVPTFRASRRPPISLNRFILTCGTVFVRFFPARRFRRGAFFAFRPV